MTITREDEIDEQAKIFCEQHPRVKKLFTQFTKEIIYRGFKNYSAMAIFQRIRWETDQADTQGKSMFKLNNNYAPWFARQFMDENPQYKGFFRTRLRISAFQAARGLPELTPKDFEYDT
jgi:hypothetical protein